VAKSSGVDPRHQPKCRSRVGEACNCKPSFQAWFWDRYAKKKRHKTFRTAAAAREWRSKALTQLNERGARPAEEEAPRLREAWKTVLDGARAGHVLNKQKRRYKPSVLRRYEECFRLRLDKPFGALRLNEITSHVIQKEVDKWVAAGASASTVRSTVMPLQVIYRWAKRRYPAVEGNPTQGLDLPAVDPGRDEVADPSRTKTMLSRLDLRERVVWGLAFYADFESAKSLPSAGPTLTSRKE
jgi:hypothetical protein